MKLLHVTTAIAALALVTPALAEPPKNPGASEYAPGQKMQENGSVKGDPGASGYAPGDKMEDQGSVKGDPGASGYSPGDQAKDKDKSSSGSAAGTKGKY
jgi:hypothetical protein